MNRKVTFTFGVMSEIQPKLSIFLDDKIQLSLDEVNKVFLNLALSTFWITEISKSWGANYSPEDNFHGIHSVFPLQQCSAE